jgi:hypothetical protein
LICSKSGGESVLPFTRDQFFALFVEYNKAVWPVQIGAYVLGIAMVILVIVPSRGRNRIIGVGLAAMWAWTGMVYFRDYFASIDRAADVFAGLFVLQAALLLYSTAILGHEKFRVCTGARAWVGWSLIAYATVLYPLLGLWTKHSLEALPMFGITPCPVTIFTLGLLLLARPMAWWLLAIPFLWSLVGGSAAFLLGVPQDWVLLASGVAVLWVALRRGGHPPSRLRPSAS